MAKAKRRSFAKDVESAIRRLLNDHPDDDLTAQDIAKLVLDSGMVHGDLLDGLRNKALTQYIGSVLRRAHLEMDDGTPVRVFQTYRKFTQSDDGREVQLDIWKDIDRMSREQMLIASKARVKHIGDSRESLKADLKYWNVNVRPRVGGAQIRLEF